MTATLAGLLPDHGLHGEGGGYNGGFRNEVSKGNHSVGSRASEASEALPPAVEGYVTPKVGAKRKGSLSAPSDYSECVSSCSLMCASYSSSALTHIALRFSLSLA